MKGGRGGGQVHSMAKHKIGKIFILKCTKTVFIWRGGNVLVKSVIFIFNWNRQHVRMPERSEGKNVLKIQMKTKCISQSFSINFIDILNENKARFMAELFFNFTKIIFWGDPNIFSTFKQMEKLFDVTDFNIWKSLIPPSSPHTCRSSLKPPFFLSPIRSRHFWLILVRFISPLPLTENFLFIWVLKKFFWIKQENRYTIFKLLRLACLFMFKSAKSKKLFS